MRIRRRRDTWLSTLSDLTGIAGTAALLELGRLVDDVIETDRHGILLADWTGVPHAIAVVGGQVSRPAHGRMYGIGDVFVSDPLETIRSTGAVALIAREAEAGRLAALLAGNRRTDVDRARSQRRLPGVFLDRMRQPAGHPRDREDGLAASRHHAAHLT